MIRRILVLGGGSAGLLAACSCKLVLPEVELVVLQSSAIGIIKVGEATIPTVPLHLHDDLKIDLAEFYREVQPSWKLGIRFLWGRRPYFNYSFDPQTTIKFRDMPRASGYYCGDDFEYAGVQSAMMTLDRAFERQAGGGPQFIYNVAYHLENERMVGFLERYASRLGVTFQEGVVNQVMQNEQGVESLRLESGETLSADFFVDCSGFRSVLLGGALGEPYIEFSSSLFCDRAVVGSWLRGDEPIKPYTISETMDSGWCWQIDHPDRINRGYVYSSAYIDDGAAEDEFRRKNPKVESTFVVRFRSGRHARGWVKNVAGVGNAAGFVEPLESTSLGEICASSHALARSLRESQLAPGPAIRDAFNRRFARSWDVIRSFLAIHYKFNTRLATAFWQACVNDTNLAGGEEMVRYYQENGPSTIWRDALTDVYDLFNIEGWYTLLVGLQVPHHSRYVPSQAEWEAWRQIRQAVRRKAEAAMTSEEALRIINSPAWKWNQSFYEGARK